MSGGDKDRRQGRVAEKCEPRPVAVLAAHLGVTFGHYELIPFVVHSSDRALGIEFQNIPGLQRFPSKQTSPESPVFKREFCGQYYLAIIVVVDCNLVVPDVAGSKPDNIPPTDETKYSKEKLVQRFRLKRRPMHEFMARCAPEEIAEGAVNKQRGEQKGDRPDPAISVYPQEDEVSQCPGQETQSQVPQGLAQPLQIAPLSQLLHHSGINFAAVPTDRLVLEEFLRVTHVDFPQMSQLMKPYYNKIITNTWLVKNSIDCLFNMKKIRHKIQ